MRQGTSRAAAGPVLRLHLRLSPETLKVPERVFGRLRSGKLLPDVSRLSMNSRKNAPNQGQEIRTIPSSAVLGTHVTGHLGQLLAVGSGFICARVRIHLRFLYTFHVYAYHRECPHSALGNIKHHVVSSTQSERA